jgi:hypothetical protein
VLTNRQLQEQLQQATQRSPSPEPLRGKQSMPNRLWQATTESVRRTVQTVSNFGRSVGMAVLAAGGAVAGVLYAARKQIASVSGADAQHRTTLPPLDARSIFPSFLPKTSSKLSQPCFGGLGCWLCPVSEAQAQKGG